MNILIIGGGFAGIEAARAMEPLTWRRSDVSITLFDAYPYTTMWPGLPQMISGEFGFESVTGDIRKLLPPAVEFKREKVTRVDLRRKVVATAQGEYGYDYLVLACGSKTNLHGFNQSLENVHTLDPMENALRMDCSLTAYFLRSEHPTVVIAGGSYTGIELACSIYKAGKRYGKDPHIVIVEAGREILNLLDERTRLEAMAQIRRLGFRTITGSHVDEFNGRDVHLSTGETFPDAFFCWCAGTKRAIDDIDGDFETIPDGRIVVNEALQVPKHPEVFAPADTGAVRYHGQYLRKAVNFAFYSGKWAGRNIMRILRDRPPRPFRPIDLGEVLPLYDTSAGYILGFITGKTGLRLHYFMSGYRNFNAANRLEFWAKALAPVE